jgi:hypothetical protein
MTARMITLHDICSFAPDVHVAIEEFTVVIGCNFLQPEEGLGWDVSPSAHMLRMPIRPTTFLSRQTRRGEAVHSLPPGGVFAVRRG